MRHRIAGLPTMETEKAALVLFHSKSNHFGATFGHCSNGGHPGLHCGRIEPLVVRGEGSDLQAIKNWNRSICRYICYLGEKFGWQASEETRQLGALVLVRGPRRGVH